MPLGWIQFDPPNGALELFGVKLVGINAGNGRKVLFSLGLIVALWALRFLLNAMARAVIDRVNERVGFWVRQVIHLLLAVMLVIGLASVWFDDPGRLATAAGLVAAGLAFALQRVVTALAGYLLILRGKTFNVGDRIVMGGVRGDVIALDFLQTTIMEMGQPPQVQSADPAMWVKARQYTGRIVTVTNARVFDEPVYNYTREFAYLWEELTLPVSYKDDRAAAERILLEVAREHTVKIEELSEPAIAEMERRYVMRRADLQPRVYWRLTDNWLEMTVRFITPDHGVRDIKDAMARGILPRLDAAGVGIASGTYDIVGLPPIRLEPPARPA